MTVTFDKVFGIHQYTMAVRNRRAEVLAGNLANSETPGYKARDLDFDRALMQEGHLTMKKSDEQMVKTNERHMDLNDLPREPEMTLKYRLPYQADTGNGNTMETNVERMKHVNNTLEYQASLQFLTGRIQKLMSAMKSNG